ncbi:hypothetical protein B0T25DRAFT_56627 [Lasiosphaeria hispida]|uniref:F-box domain-containing protein n=1 Tax=Lasiosphaeria hispida TaxID=260671 RepID=A0AAJ0HW34_9PEZI|nr:hypothetical protein B0T25DRAFT_56627 [Lasiosphaeria hispida]
MRRQLLDLPEELLLAIMRVLDPTSIQFLRRTHRIFLRLFSDPCFRHWQYDDLELSATKNGSMRFPWVRANLDFEKQAFNRSFRYIMNLEKEQKQCLSCRMTRVENPGRAWDLANKFLYCEACHVDHPSAFFSPAERKKGDEDRVCIGHEGYIRLCEHEVITKKMVVEAMPRLMGQGTTTAGEVVLLTCRHPSHLPTHHDTEADDLGLIHEHPTVMLKRVGSGVSAYIDLTWTGHLPLPEKGAQYRFTANDMATYLDKFRRGAAEYIVPQAAPGGLPEMRCFDPNRCCCLDLDGTYTANAPYQWSLVPGLCDRGPCCHADPSRRLAPLTPASVLRGTENKGAMTPSPGHTHYARTYLGHAYSLFCGWAVDVNSCQSGEHCLEIFYRRRIPAALVTVPIWHTAEHSWLEAIDPDSYRLWEDAETRGTLWCTDASCTNYYRYLERPIIRECCGSALVDIYKPQQSSPPHKARGVEVPLHVLAKREELAAERKRLAIVAPTVVVKPVGISAGGFWRKCGRNIRSRFAKKKGPKKDHTAKY